MRLKYYTCYAISNIFYTLGDIASKPMSWGWMDGDYWIESWIASVDYRIYNWLMLKSVYFNDLGGCDIWGDYPTEDCDTICDPCENDEDDKFTCITFTKEEKDV